MGFGGSAAAMIQSIRNNAKQLAKRESYFEKDVETRYKNSPKIVDYKKMSPDKFAAFKQKLKENEYRRQRHLITVFGIIMLIIIVGMIYFLFF